MTYSFERKVMNAAHSAGLAMPNVSRVPGGWELYALVVGSGGYPVLDKDVRGDVKIVAAGQWTDKADVATVVRDGVRAYLEAQAAIDAERAQVEQEAAAAGVLTIEQFAEIVVPVVAVPSGLRYELELDLTARTNVLTARLWVMWKRYMREEGYGGLVDCAPLQRALI